MGTAVHCTFSFIQRDNQALLLRPTLIRRLEGLAELLQGYILLSIDQPEGYLNRLGLNQPLERPLRDITAQKQCERKENKDGMQKLFEAGWGR